MKMTYDKDVDAAYIYLRSFKKSHRTEEMSEDIYVDYDKDGSMLGIEILSASRRIPMKTLLAMQQLA